MAGGIKSAGQSLAHQLALPHRPVAEPGVAGAWFDIAFVLTVSPFTGWVLGLTAIGTVDARLGLPLLALSAAAHAAWMRTFPA